ncbi:hypothetical protein Lal_00028978 [Lupinus albus]|nr:hypothetical protein Lal_00028978 [Lupinus albus]
MGMAIVDRDGRKERYLLYTQSAKKETANELTGKVKLKRKVIPYCSHLLAIPNVHDCNMEIDQFPPEITYGGKLGFYYKDNEIQHLPGESHLLFNVPNLQIHDIWMFQPNNLFCLQLFLRGKTKDALKPATRE